ncbi:MAG: M23 family metallopeptidase [Candidatus Microbacterium phytovorans]|uniref:M23 family metallopeptidase n=1 Tax=Candidatus Microbacterium phytovorans TaxID=3121374 RepID=A0AAJ5W2A5_9MICO|nr:M23 family metallopeptidase [Microbacterium sp.]WEK14529.1 MAG: M23 family metallopeptidase [Microbacterium sp.]
MHRLFAPVVLTMLVLAVLPWAGHASAAVAAEGVDGESEWTWPTAPVRVARPFDLAHNPYGAGHRGVDLAAASGTVVKAPTTGVIVFAGVVVDRGVVTIDRGDGYLVSLEPVSIAEVTPGASVTVGESLTTVARGGHTMEGEVHVGIRLDGAYVDPTLLLGRLPRAVLLPCCAAGTPLLG